MSSTIDYEGMLDFILAVILIMLIYHFRYEIHGLITGRVRFVNKFPNLLKRMNNDSFIND